MGGTKAVGTLLDNADYSVGPRSSVDEHLLYIFFLTCLIWKVLLLVPFKVLQKDKDNTQGTYIRSIDLKMSKMVGDSPRMKTKPGRL